ncbi:MAG: hypothetical protein AAF990_19045 [Bacteroidota bacterium]
MKSLRTRLLTITLALACFVTLMSFSTTSDAPANVSSEDIVLAYNGRWISAGDEFVNGVLYHVKQCVAGNRVHCVLNSKRYTRARNQIVAEEEYPVLIGEN